MRRKNGFSMTELLVVLAVIAMLAALLIPTLSRSRNTAYRVYCLHNLGQIQLASSMYSMDNAGILPPHEPGSKWPSQLQSVLKNPRVLFCPVDVLDLGSSPTNFTSPFDALQRSYIMNGFYDFFQPPRLSPAEYSLLSKGQAWDLVNEAAINDPSATLLFGEKNDTNVFYLDITAPNLGFLATLNESRHGVSDRSAFASASGANYGLGDGSVTFLKFGLDTSPLNMWGLTDFWRTNASICRPR
jgi:prepilin-type N-terminal cleavage/methylation domain-containing protein